VLRLTHLIDNLLDSSRLIDAGSQLYFHPEEIELAALLHEICQLHREIAPGRRIEEQFAGPLQMAGDPKLLFQAFSNLVSNAIKYSASGSAVEVSARQEAGMIVVTVKDNGIGIPASDMDQLFERYYRGSNVSGIVGTGVGLYLVRMVVEAHGGEVSVESIEGTGSRFSVRLPVRAAPKHATASPPGLTSASEGTVPVAEIGSS
jgi:signal transduction histidine kinase